MITLICYKPVIFVSQLTPYFVLSAPAKNAGSKILLSDSNIILSANRQKNYGKDRITCLPYV